MLKNLRFVQLPCLLLLCGSILSQTDTARITQLNNEAWKLKNTNRDSAVLLARMAFDMLNSMKADERTYPKWKGLAYAKNYYYQGMMCNQTQNAAQAIGFFSKTLAISDSIGYEYGKSLAYGGFGSFYQSRANYGKALDYYYRALRIEEKRGNKDGILVRLSNIGTVYDIKKNYIKAIQYFSLALKLARELDNKRHISILLANIGVVYYEQDDYDHAIDYFSQALAMEEKLGISEGIARNLSNIGTIYKDREDYDKAFDYFTKAMAPARAAGDAELEGSILGSLGSLYVIKKDYKKAEENFRKTLEMAYTMQSWEMISEYETALSDLYTKMGNDKLALEHYKKYSIAKDSVFNEENTEKMVRSEMNYAFEKQQTVQQSEHEKEVIALEADNRIQKQLRLFLLIFIALILVSLFFVKRAYDRKKHIAQMMAEESHRKETLLQEVHHRINNNLQVISSLLTLQANSVGDERLHDYLQQSQNRIQSLSTLHELLYQNDSPLQINMEEYVNKVLDFHRDVLSSKKPGVKIETSISSVYFASKLAVPVALVVNELATNSIKYAFNAMESGQINVSLSPDQEKDGSWVLSFSDNGTGLPAETHVRKESLGLRLVNMMAKQMGALITKTNSPGATFIFTFPVSK